MNELKNQPIDVNSITKELLECKINLQLQTR
jgi:hypothetical protein